MLSLAPLVVFCVAAAGLVIGSRGMTDELVHLAGRQLGTGAAQLVTTVLQQATKPGAGVAATLISLALALLGASGLFGQLTDSVNSIWNVKPPPGGNLIKSFVLAKTLAVLMALVFIILILMWIAIESVIAYIRGHTGGYAFWPLISVATSIGFLTLVFAVTFRSLPKGMVAWRDVWIPAVSTAIGFTAAKFVLTLYFGFAKVGAAYGPAGALVVILIWFYYSSQIFFYGVELTFAYAYEHGSHKEDIPGELQLS